MSSKISGTDSSMCFEDVESDDLSLETWTASNHTLSADDSDSRTRDKKWKKRRIAKQLAERKQLIHDLHLLKVELQQKNLVMKGLKSEHSQHIEDLEERFNDLAHQNHILQARLEAQVQGQGEQHEAMKRQQTISKEVRLLKTKQQHLEAVNERLQEKAGQVRQSLRDLSLSTEHYYQLKGLPGEELSLRDYIAMRVYDIVRPLQTEIDHLRLAGRTQDEQIAVSAAEVLQLKERLEEEHTTNVELRIKLQEASQSYADNSVHPTTDDRAAASQGEVKNESHEMVSKREQTETTRQLNNMNGVLDNLTKERDHLAAQLSIAQQSATLLKQDKEYLCRQVTEVTKRTDLAEDRLQQVTRQLDDARHAREEAYEKYVTCRDQYKWDYEKKLQEELDTIRASTTVEMDHLRTSTKDMYERENRNLREARDTALAERATFQTSAKEISVKCEELTAQLREVQCRTERELCELQNDVKLKSLQAERSQMVCEETMSSLKDKAKDVELLQKKAEMLRKEYYTLQTVMEKRVSELETQLVERSSQVDMYERLERELDHLILQAADTTNDNEAEKVLLPYANAPSSVKRRMEHSLQLAKRVLQLERDKNALQRDIEEERSKVRQLTGELEKSRAILGQVQQPHRYLVDCIRERDQQVEQLQSHIHMLEQELRQTDEEKKGLQETPHKMSQDLKRLHHQTKDMMMLKQAVTTLTARQRGQSRPPGWGEDAVRAESVRSTPSQSPRDLMARHVQGPSPQVRQGPWKKNTRKKVACCQTSQSKPLKHLKR